MVKTLMDCLFSAGVTFFAWHLLTVHDDCITSGFFLSVTSGGLWTLTILDFFDRRRG